MKLPEIGEKGQKLFFEATVLAVGAGGLGCAALPWLARAGIGRIIVVDPGTIDEPDLGRQLLYRQTDIGEHKANVAARELALMNPNIEVLPVPLSLNAENVRALTASATVILDGTDQIEPRRVINTYCVATGIPWVYGGAIGWVGSVYPYLPGHACWECAFGDAPGAMSCDEAGVIGPIVGWVGAVQASAVLRIVLGEMMGGQLLTADLARSVFRTLKVQKKSDCPVCASAEQKSER